MGSIRGIVTLGDLIFVCGLGRFAYVYRGKRQVCKVYLKQKLTAILPLQSADVATDDDDQSDDGEEGSGSSDGEVVDDGEDDEEDGLDELDESDGSSEGDFGDFDEDEVEEPKSTQEGRKRKQKSPEGDYFIE
ncbi:conserved hypothetical protein [Perkinsus marinus ATCC 50983]|uniref:Uncharacterized protein n=1 Tax=Perkinsus marinus (strain ATCC 50983 / TXsc) TaxID=423536 RepID=C5LB73_PERM5|nr:conserved hypothetical protein [Perkinsus marinus ATCC 50983]EER06001.1 conserved hypothetical protein [Perkinsus marinus ATCC 50983]|eukprot:XP_002774185.1 conserved hypothetical protein [Perkinsus marinus ATCC 50983]